MANLNSVQIIGRLTSDPVLKELPSGTKLVNFSLATSRTYRDKNEEKQEEVTFVDCELFGNQAGILADYAGKGKELFIQGRLRQDRWEDKESGDKRQKIVIHVENFQFLGSAKQSQDDGRQSDDVEAEKPVDKKVNNKKPNKKIPF